MAAKPKKLDIIQTKPGTAVSLARPGDSLSLGQWATKLFTSNNGLGFVAMLAVLIGGVMASLLMSGGSTTPAGVSADAEAVKPLSDPVTQEKRDLTPKFAALGKLDDEQKDFYKNLAFEPTVTSGGSSVAGAASNSAAVNQPDPFEVAEITVSEPAKYVPPGGDERSATHSVTVTGVLRNKSGRDCRRISLKAFFFDAFGQVIGQGGTTLADISASKREGTKFTLTVSGMPTDAKIVRWEVVPANPYWAVKIGDR